MKAKQIAYLVMVSLVFVSLASPVLAHAGEDDYDHHGMMNGFYSGMGWFGMGFWMDIHDTNCGSFSLIYCLANKTNTRT